MSKLALKGGKPIKHDDWGVWPIGDSREKDLLSELVIGGNWSYNGPKETQILKMWSDFIGSKYAVAVANGTVSIQLCLEALDIGFGDEVILPGLTWQATAATVLDVNAIPILVDVEEDSWCMDPQKIEAAITPRTKAIIAVHLYGTICNMDEISKIAKKHNLFIIEDAAHQHGSIYKGRKVGTLGDLASFSLQNSKVLTCGEGGLITTNSFELHEKVDALRNCGRRPAAKEFFDNDTGNYVSEGHFIQSGNYRITEFQAAVLIGQIEKLEHQLQTREENALYLNSLFENYDGIKPLRREPGTDLQSYFNIGFRYNKSAFSGLDVETFRAALSAELNFPVMASYAPLNNCPLYSPLTKKRHKISDEYTKAIDPSRFDLPVASKIYTETSLCCHHKILLGTKNDMDKIYAAVEKIKLKVSELL